MTSTFEDLPVNAPINLFAATPASVPLPSSEALVREAHTRWLASLRINGNCPSPDHQLAGWQLLRAMVDQLYGERTGRYAYALHCGAGKTQAVVALLSAMFALRVFARGKSVLVVAQQVTALCDIKQKLIDAGVPERSVGIVHTKTLAAFPSTNDQKRPIMLATHARIQRDGTLPECCRKVDGGLHDLVIWDEALISTEALALALDTTLTALMHFASSGKCPTVEQTLVRSRTTFEQEQAAQEAGQAPREIPPLVSEQESEAVERELKSMGHLDDTGKALQDRALRGISLLRNPMSLLDPRNGNSAALMRYVIRVPDRLKNIVILDASHAIDELRQADDTVLRGTTDAMTNFKDFGNVLAIHYPLPAGKSTITRDGKAIMQAVRIAQGLPEDDPVLFVTFKEGHDRRLREELRAAGIPIDRKTEAGKNRLNVITWGRHTTDNSYTHCKHVVLVGLYRLSLVVLASQYAAQRRDLTRRRDKPGLLALERSVIAGHAMQALNRGCMRLTGGDGMAHRMTAHIIDKDDLRPLLERAMPNLQWETSAVSEPTRTEEAIQRIVAHMLNVPEAESKVSKRSIFAALDIQLASAAKAEAMSKAKALLDVKGLSCPRHRWTVAGQSLVRMRTE